MPIRTQRLLCLLIFTNFLFLSSIFATSTKTNSLIAKQVGTIQVLFDVTRVIAPALISNTKNPISARAFLPVCPPGSNYVSGVNPNIIELDQYPLYSYCNCICKGNCSGLTGITSQGGRQPIYTATVTCSARVQGWFDSNVFTQSSTTLPNVTQAHQYYYCQAGNCGTNPLPASLAYSVPIGGYANTTKIDFQACGTLANNICGAPDPSSPGRPAGTLP